MGMGTILIETYGLVWTKQKQKIASIYFFEEGEEM